MRRTYRRFLNLLAIEMESLQEELEMIIDTLDDRLKRHEITDYVRNENFAVLRNEALGVRDCLQSCADLELADAAADADFDEVQDLDELTEMVKACMRKRLEDHGYVEAVYQLVERRIEKIRAYLSVDDDASVV